LSIEEEALAAGRNARAISITEKRTLTDEERLLVRKILACAARMQGRFGKGLLASTLRGSRARNVAQMGLDRLSTYGILSDMTHDGRRLPDSLDYAARHGGHARA
jgi:superfamily II DNA helicase RecQ